MSARDLLGSSRALASATSAGRGLPVDKAAAGLVLAGTLAYAVTVVAAGIATPGYDATTQLISELGAVGAPASDVMSAMLIAIGAVAIAFAGALGSVDALATPSGRALVAALGGSLVLGGLFPCDPRCDPVSFSGWAHLVTAGPGVIACLVAPFVFARRLHGRGWRGRATVSASLGGAAIVAHVLLFTAAPALGCVGLGQRVATLVPLAWLGVLATWVLRPPVDDRFPPGPGPVEALWRLRERSAPLTMLTRLADERGGVVGLRGPGARAVVVTSAALIESLFVRHASRITQWGMSQFGPVLGEGLLTADGDAWRRRRRLLQPLFLERRVPAYAPRIASIAARVLDHSPTGRVDVHALSVRAATEIANGLLFADDSEEVARLFAETQERIMRHFARSVTGVPLPLWWPTPANRALMASVRRLDVAIRGCIARRREAGGPSDDFLGTLLASDLDETEIRDECVTMLLAASETTASGLAWTLHLLAGDPERQRALAAKVRRVIGDAPPSAAHLERLPELRHALLEALRLYTPVWAIGRVAVEDLTLGEHRLPAGTQIFAVPAIAHRARDAFDDAEAFVPERWACPHALRAAGPRFRPFGAGPRKCIGEHLGLLELSILLASVLQRWDLAPAETPEVLATVTLRPRHGLYLQVTPA